MIEVKHLTKVFVTEEVETTSLNNLDLKVRTGEFLSIMGPSGCGKSTLLNIVGLLDSPTKGEYYFDGIKVSGLPEYQKTVLRRGNIGFVFQNFNLIDELTIFENIELPLIYLKVPAKERKKRIFQALEKIGIQNRSRHFPQQLSGGQQQRVAIVRAVIAKPKLILADEPTGNLDSSNGTMVMKLLDNLNQEGTTVVMVTHSEKDSEYSDRIIRLLDGKIIKNA